MTPRQWTVEFFVFQTQSIMPLVISVQQFSLKISSLQSIERAGNTFSQLTGCTDDQLIVQWDDCCALPGQPFPELTFCTPYTLKTTKQSGMGMTNIGDYTQLRLNQTAEYSYLSRVVGSDFSDKPILICQIIADCQRQSLSAVQVSW